MVSICCIGCVTEDGKPISREEPVWDVVLQMAHFPLKNIWFTFPCVQIASRCTLPMHLLCMYLKYCSDLFFTLLANTLFIILFIKR